MNEEEITQLVGDMVLGSITRPKIVRAKALEIQSTVFEEAYG